MQKQLEGTKYKINEQCNDCHIVDAHAIIVGLIHALPAEYKCLK